MAVYLRSLASPFVWEDEINVLANQHIKSLTYIPDLFLQRLWQSSGYQTSYYRPLVDLSYMVDHALGGARPFIYHLSSVIYHAAASWALWGLALELGLSLRWGWLAALLFLVHPVMVESVSYATIRDTPLLGLFSIYGLLLWARWRREGGGMHLAGAFACQLGALFTKESGAAFPGLLLLWEVLRSGWRLAPRRGAAALAASFALSALHQGWRLKVIGRGLGGLSGGADPDPVHPTALGRLATSIRLVPEYLGQWFWPSGLHPDRWTEPSSGWLDPRALASLALVAVILWAAWRLRERRSGVGLGLAWYIAAFLPVSNIIPLRPVMADRFAYLPYAGLALASAGSFEVLERRLGSKARALALAWAVLLSWLSFSQTRHWTSLRAVAQRSLAYNPKSFGMHTNLGVEHFRHGRLKEAAAAFEASLRVRPSYAPALNNLGAILEQSGDGGRALSFYEAALRADPTYILARQNRAKALARGGDLPGAEREWRRVLELFPQDPESRRFLQELERLRASPRSPPPRR